MTGAIRAYAGANQAPVVVPFILGGAMGPVTLAGDIAQAHAETLVGVALGQLVRPRLAGDLRQLPVVDGAASGAPTFGTPEPAIGSLVVGQLARRVGLPLRCSGAFTTSQGARRPGDARVGGVDAGGDPVRRQLHPPLGGMAGGRAGDGLREVRRRRRLLRRAAHVPARDRPVRGAVRAWTGSAEVGPGKHFFGAQHTLRHYETAFWDSWTADNSSFEQWRDAGERRVEERAADKVAELLADYEPPPIDDAVDEALRDFIDPPEGRRCPTCGTDPPRRHTSGRGDSQADIWARRFPKSRTSAPRKREMAPSRTCGCCSRRPRGRVTSDR